MTYSPTSPSPLDGDTPLSPDELRAVRMVLRDADRASWARRQLKVIVPALVAVVVAVAGAWEWAAKHLKVTP